MLEKERPESKRFSHVISNVQEYIDLIGKDGKGCSIRLSGPREDIFCRSYAMLFFDLSKGKRILVPISSEKRKEIEIFNMVRNLKSPDRFDFSSMPKINMDRDVRKQLMFDCFFSNLPIAIIAFGKSKETKQESAALYVTGDNSPQEIYTIIRCIAVSYVVQHDPNIAPPRKGEFN